VTSEIILIAGDTYPTNQSKADNSDQIKEKPALRPVILS